MYIATLGAPPTVEHLHVQYVGGTPTKLMVLPKFRLEKYTAFHLKQTWKIRGTFHKSPVYFMSQKGKMWFFSSHK